MVKPLWSPSSQAIDNSLLTQFTRNVAQKRTLVLKNYNELHAWSIQNPDEFWSDYWEFSEMQASRKSEVVVEDLDKFPGARWFPGSKLNYAQNLLSHRSSQTAHVSILENC